ncbi:MAG TPA: hypothetical protein VE130_00690 [Nitrososphaeraceae archaeon]|nr:hypothetical protein [Nitrososphaeraceae archaeon]
MKQVKHPKLFLELVFACNYTRGPIFEPDIIELLKCLIFQVIKNKWLGWIKEKILKAPRLLSVEFAVITIRKTRNVPNAQ